MGSFRQHFVWQPGHTHKAPAAHRQHCDLVFCDIVWASARLLWILSLEPLLFIASSPSSFSFQSYGHYSIHEGLPSLGWSQIPKLPLCLHPSSFLPFPSTPCGLISIWASLLGKSTRKERWWAEGIGEDSASHAIDVGVPSVGSQAISNGAVFVSQKRLEEGIRNLSSGFAMGLRRGSTPTASHCPTFRALSVSGNRHPPQPRLCCTSTEPGISSLVTNHS